MDCTLQKHEYTVTKARRNIFMMNPVLNIALFLGIWFTCCGLIAAQRHLCGSGSRAGIGVFRT